jgi:hypothetical protein
MPPIRSTYRSMGPATPSNGDDQTRHAVPVPSRSMTCTLLNLSAVGKTAMLIGANHALPDWLKHT